MIMIDDILISDDVLEKKFVCNLAACKGACCIEGDSGAPLEEDEAQLIENHLEAILPYLTEKGREALIKNGAYLLEEDDEYTGIATTLIDSGPCAYITYLEDGVTVSCGIEHAWQDGKIPFRKPISCHLYPVRIKHFDEMTAVNFDEWEICDPACALGEKLQVPVYQFVKEALIRKFGEEFYEVLEQAAKENQ